MKKNYMFTPGPTMVPAEILQAEASPVIHHRTKQFAAIMDSVHAGLKQVFMTEQPVYILMGSGTSAMEAAVCNVVSPGDKAICVNGGKFGERWRDLCKTYGAKVVEIELEWGKSFTVEMAADALKQHPDAVALYITQSETSTGAYTDIEAIAKLTRQSDTLLVVDSITGIGVHEFKFDEWGVDIAVSGSQKGFMMPPGLAFICVSERTWDRVAKCTSPRYYLDLGKMKKSHGKGQTPFTTAVSLIRALEKALDMILDEGIEQIVARHAQLAAASRAALTAMGIDLLADSPANGVTAFMAPDGVDIEKARKAMESAYGVQIAGGQDPYKGKIARIGHMGYVAECELIVVIGALENALRDAGYVFEFGAGVKAAHEVLANS